MKNLIISTFLIVGMVAGVDAAPVTRGRASGVNSDTVQQSAQQEMAPVAARATRTQSTVKPAGVSARSATTQPKVQARAATTTQKVVNSGTKIAGATKNTAVNEECQNKYFGCMDAFCMLDNTSGGRCICSDRNAELDSVLAEIEALDQQSYQMATFGVEQIEMGENADAAIAKANAVADSTIVSQKKSARKELDLSMWDTSLDFDISDDVFSATGNVIEGKTGDALHRAAADLCMAQIPECSAEKSVLQLLYAQRIKSDCSAYENSLKQQKNASQNKLSAAQRALREAALEQMQNANKYDLGQCTIQFKRCMQTTAECGDDFAKCASVVAMDNTNVNKSTSKKAKPHAIKGAVTTIEISASTYDTLLAKKPLCENVTKSCVAVADKVWDTFMRDVAPALKSAELIAEDNVRQSCIGNISSCFQKACKDNINPNDPDGSYDMCLTRPETMLSLCKIPLNACGIDEQTIKNNNFGTTNSEARSIWNFVVARLASMRVDACTRDVKECLQAEDRCGKGYTQCIGLDRDTIIAMCPIDKLVGCQENGEKKSLAELSDLVMGIFLNIDDSMLTECQSAVTTKMLELCGDTSSCVAFSDDNDIGTESLLSYKDNDGNYVIEGLVSFSNVKIAEIGKTTDEDGNIINEAMDPKNVKLGRYEVDISDYMENMKNADTVTSQRIMASLQSAANKINQKIAILSEDSKIKMCVEGRDMSQIRSRSDMTSSRTTARYPNLLDSSILAIINSGIEQATKNYIKKYNKLVGEAVQTANDETKSVLCAAMASSAPVCVEYKATDEGESICTKYETNNFDNVFQATEKSGMDYQSGDLYATRYVISGANMKELTRIQQSGHSDFVQTDSHGNMLGRIVTSATYSPTSHTCTLITESVMCKDAEAIITENKYTESCTDVSVFTLGGGSGGCGSGSGNIGGVGMGRSATNTNLIQSYHGTVCKEFGEPVITTTAIEM